MMMATGEHQLTKWLTPVTKPYTLSLSNEGHLLVLRESQNILEVYSLNATLIHRLRLSQEVKDARHVVQTSIETFLLLHRLNDSSSAPFVISELANDGHLVQRFVSRSQSEELSNPTYLSLDEDNNLLFVADYGNNRVVLFDSNVLTWKQVLLANGIHYPMRLLYDTNKKHLFVAQHHARVAVYKLN